MKTPRRVTSTPPRRATVLSGGAAAGFFALLAGACISGGRAHAVGPQPDPPEVTLPAQKMSPPAVEGVLAANQAEPSERTGRTSRPLAAPQGPILPFERALDRPAARERSLAVRQSRRAYAGAPPVLPHSADFGSGEQACIDCHARGMRLADRVGRAISHPPLAGCLQCHVEGENEWLSGPPPTENTFVGRPEAGAGERWAGGAPPMIPHALQMRGRCLSCHGELGWEGLRTDHPQRANCVQCHVPAADRQQLTGSFVGAEAER